MTQRGPQPNGVPRTLPPGQQATDDLPVQHYGRVPRFRPDSWSFLVYGATAADEDRVFTLEELNALPQTEIVADLHCVSRHTTLDLRWSGAAVRAILAEVPPAQTATHALVTAEYGYSATVRIEDLASPRALLATHLDGEPLTPEHGFPMRLVLPHLYGYKGPKWVRGIEYCIEPTRGFWEQRGYHLIGDPWRQERYSYQE